MNFTKNDIKMLAEIERRIDDGIQPFVVIGGQRLAVHQKCLDEFGLRKGQTINDIIMCEILKWKIADCEALIDERKLNETPREAAL